MRPKNILIIVESIDVDGSSGAKASVALILMLHKAGFQVEVLHYSRKDIQLRNIPCTSIRENRLSFLFILSRVERQLRLKFKITINKYVESLFGFSFTLLNDSNSIKNSIKRKDPSKFDYVLTLSQGASFRPHHALLKLNEWHHKWLAYIHDPYPMHCYPRPYDWVDPGHHKKRNFFCQIAESTAFAVYPSQFLAEWMESYYPSLKNKRVIIPHQLFLEDNNEITLPKFFQGEKFTVLHAGTLLNARNPLILISAFKKFLQRNPIARSKSQILFLGGESNYTEQFKTFEVEMPQFFSCSTRIPFVQILRLQKEASVNVILEAKGPISPFLPGKFPHCIQAGKPILLLGPYQSESKRLLGLNYPYWSEIDNEDLILTHLETLFNIWRGSEAMPKQSFPSLMEYLSESYLERVVNNLG